MTDRVRGNRQLTYDSVTVSSANVATTRMPPVSE